MKRAILVLVCIAGTANAQPADDKTDKGGAKALMQSGLKLFAAKDYLGALAVFKDAYNRFPSSKILLNIGTTYTKLDKPADAANAYQRYLDSADADPAKKTEVQTALAELDKRVGIVELTVDPPDAEVQIGGDDWRPAGQQKKTRVAVGDVSVHARKDAFKPTEQKTTTKAGGVTTLALVLEPEPVAISNPNTGDTTITTGGGSTGALVERKTFQPEKAGRFGVFALAHVDPSGPGASGLVGLGVDVTNRISLRGGAILGKPFGAYAGASVALLTGGVRPILAVAMPVFRSDGWRAALRGAGGVEVSVHKHIALIAELGVEHLLNPEDSIEHTTMFIPAVGLSGRL